MGEAAALRRLFSNLVDNALRYGRSAAVTVQCIGDDVVVDIDDDGPGVPEAERSIVFEPFYRAEASRSRATGGAGLGLAIAKQIVEAHGGRIAIETSPLGGARFRITLPGC
jgi:signal transduction histidine kinase